jgi:hypothetical protein
VGPEREANVCAALAISSNRLDNHASHIGPISTYTSHWSIIPPPSPCTCCAGYSFDPTTRPAYHPLAALFTSDRAKAKGSKNTQNSTAENADRSYLSTVALSLAHAPQVMNLNYFINTPPPLLFFPLTSPAPPVFPSPCYRCSSHHPRPQQQAS